MQNKKIVVLGTGGTIAGKAVSSSETAAYQAGQIEVRTLLQEIPGISKIAQVECEQLYNIDSADITLSMMLELRNKTNSLLAKEEITAVVITHGTDTLEETAYFLNLTINSSKPVVLVGAMRPATAFSADGTMNLLNAVQVALSEQAINKGILVVMNERIYAAREVTKTSTTNVDAFKSFELGCLGSINGGCVNFYQQSLRKHTVNSAFAKISEDFSFPKVEVLYCVAGMDYSLIEVLVNQGGKGIVIAGFGNGNINSKYKETLHKVSKAGTKIVIASRVASGTISESKPAQTAGIICSGSLNPQKARILLMLALNITDDSEKIQEIFATH